MLKAYIRFTVKHPVITILFISLFTLFFAYQIWNPWMAGQCLGSFMKDDTACWWSWKLKMVVDPKTILPQDHPYVRLNDRIEKTFGGSRVVVIGVEPSEGDIFNSQTLSTIKDITEEVKKIPGIKEENVVSIADRKVKYVESAGDTIKVERLMESVPQSKEELEAFKKRVYSNNLYVGSLVSRDGRAASIITDFREWVPAYKEDGGENPWWKGEQGGSDQGNPWWKGKQEGRETQEKVSTNNENEKQQSMNHEQAAGGLANAAQENPWWKGSEDSSEPAGGWPSGGFRMSDSAIYEAVQKASTSVESHPHVYIGGLPVALAFLEKDSARIFYLFPLALLVMMAILYWAFRSLQGMILPLLTALLSVVWALGLMGLTGTPMDPFNTLTPILILAVAAGHSIQILKRYYEELSSGKNNKEAVIEATTKIAPVTVTAALVAAASFGSLMTFQLKTFQAFGLFTAFGILSALVLELTFIPALRSIMRAPRVMQQESRPGILDRFLSLIDRHSLRGRPGRVAVVSFLILVIALVGTFQVRVDNSLKSQFFKTTRLRMDEQALNHHFAGTSTFYVLVEGDKPNALKSPEALSAIDRLQRQLEAVSGVGKTESYVDYVKKMNQTFHGGDSQYDQVPDNPQTINDFLFLYTISGNPADFARLVDYDYRQAVIWSYLKSDSTALAEDLIHQVEDYARPYAPRLTMGVAGSAPVTVALNRTMVEGKIKNILQIALIIFVASALVLRSWVGGLLVLLPLSLSVLINFGVMGWTGITLGIGTAAISAMAVGIGADYAIYLLFRIREEYRLATGVGAVGAIHELPLPEAVRKALMSSGKAIIFVALAVSAGYAILPFSGYYLHMEGILVPLAMLTSCLGALILLPALVCTFRPKFVAK
jgi:predicted RND superfamily exporter protein